MPTVSVGKEKLFKALGQSYTDEQFDELCFDFGVELDEVTSEKIMETKEKGAAASDASDEIIYKIDVPANRYDLLCLEGIARALNVFRQKQAVPQYTSVTPSPENQQRMQVTPETAAVRPYVVAAVLRGVEFDPVRYASFIDLQEKLHQNICRRRTLVAIGTHDLDTIQGPFTYTAKAPRDIKFVPLNQSKEFDAVDLFEFYEKDSHLRQYLPIIRDAPKYPVILDSNGVVLSLPPIINGNHSKITLATRNVFIECTATDLTKAKITLNTVCTMFSEYCTKPFTVETVDVTSADGSTTSYPDLTSRKEEAAVDYIIRRSGIPKDTSPDAIADMLGKMSLPATLTEDKKSVQVSVPPTRSDILHACDIMEDVAIGYGFDNIKRTLPGTTTVASQFPINKLSDQIRNEAAQAGYTEVLTFSLGSRKDYFDAMQLTDDGKSAVHIANPKTLEFEMARIALMPGLLRTVACNKKCSLPIKVFEVSDVVLKDPENDVGARNERHMCALYYGTIPSFEIIHGLLDRMLQMLDIPMEKTKGYALTASNIATFFPGRQAAVVFKGEVVGHVGVLHPDVLAAYDLAIPVSSFELNLHPFL